MSDPEQPFLRRMLAGLRSGETAPFVGVVLVATASVVLILLVISGGGSSEEEESTDPAQVLAEETEEAGKAEDVSVPLETVDTTADSSEEEFAQIRPEDSSWVEGQPSLISYEGFVAVASRALDLGRAYQQARDAEEARQEKLAGLQRKEAQRAARERALAAYREALRRAELERQRQERLLAERRERIRERLEELREKHKVEPGEECQIPEVAAAFDCETGYPF